MANRRKRVYPGKVFKLDVLEPIGMTIVGASKRLGISRKHLSAFVNGKVPCSTDMANRLATATRTSVASWLNMQTNIEEWESVSFISIHVPILSITAT